MSIKSATEESRKRRVTQLILLILRSAIAAVLRSAIDWTAFAFLRPKAMIQLQVVVRFRGESHAIPLHQAVDAVTFGHFQQQIAQQLQIPIESQRLFLKGKRCNCSQDTTLNDLFEFKSNLLKQGDHHELQTTCVVGTLLLVAGASTSDIETMNSLNQQAKRENHIRATRRIVSIQKRNDQLQSQELSASPYRFQTIEVLEHFADSHRARDILETLANDRGILAVMQKHKWTVGALAEMHPDGKVGVDPVCVLGLNQNKGQRILLRLRTDDLQGFRKFLTIKKVLYHELSHNVHSEHDSQFYQLMRQVEKESQELDWTAQSGHTLGGQSVGVFGGSSAREQLDGDSGQQLGGDSTRNRLVEPGAPQNSQTPRFNVEHLHKPARLIEREQPSSEGEHIEDVEMHQGPADKLPSDAQQERTDKSPGSSDEASSFPQMQTSTPRLANFPWEEEHLSQEQFALDASDQERRLQECMSALRQRILVDPSTKEQVVQAANLLLQIVSNLLTHGLNNEKYRSIRPANRLFATRVACFPENLRFLMALGFEQQRQPQQEASSQDQERLVFVRNDLGLLWLGKSYLELLLQMVAASSPSSSSSPAS